MKKGTLLKELLAVAFVIITALNLIVVAAYAAPSTQMPLAGSAIPQFVDPLPTLSIAPQNSSIKTLFGNTPLTIRMCEFKAAVLPVGAVVNYTGTWVWGYLVDPTGSSTCAQLINMYKNPTSGIINTYIGPVIVNERDPLDTCNIGTGQCTINAARSCTTDLECRIPTTITWINNLGNVRDTQVLAYKFSTDQTLHWADPLADWTMANQCMMNMMMKSYTDMGIPVGYPPYQNDPCALNYGESPAGTFNASPIPAVVHLHGGEVPAEIDGSPDSWFTSDGVYVGHKYYSKNSLSPKNYSIYSYPNAQEAAQIWFHDHTLGATRLNVYAGLAGAYFIYDPNLSLPANLQPLNEVVPIVIQDRMFDTNGQLFFQADSNGGLLWATNPEHPYWSPEFVGDSIVVNGKAWPFHNVDKKRNRFLFLNGSNARTYELFLVDPVTKAFGPPMWVIGTDGGYLDTPQKLDPALGQRLVIQPGERYEVIIDFADTTNNPTPSGSLILRNIGRTPYPKGAPPQGTTLGQIMKFVIGAVPTGGDVSYNPATDGAIRTNNNQKIVRLPGTPGGPAIVTTGTNKNVQKIRQLTLNEVMGMPMTVTDPVTGIVTAYPGGPMEILVNNTKWDGGVDHMNMNPVKPCLRPDFSQKVVNGVTTCYSELPTEGDTEIWEVVNLTADAHPIHLHLVQFQLINRQNFNVTNYTAAYNAAFPATCTKDPAGTGFCPAYGPPLDYNTGNPRALGGNPDIAATKMTKKGLQPLYLQGNPQPPLPQEQGWKDTVIMYPGQVTRIAARWAPTDTAIPTNGQTSSLYFPFDPTGDNALFNYVWHCHIIDHEDNEMMRPDVVQANPSGPTRTLVKGVDY
jgi:FtsP/CotA-like multicopper oxidase with cupredoxin domain